MSLDARTTSSSDWRYVSEGGATIVFSYVGTHIQEFIGMVLRLRKAKLALIPLSLPSPSASEQDEEFLKEEEDPTVLFQQRVTSRLIPPEHLPKLIPCRVSYELLSGLRTASDTVRPKERTQIDAIDTRRRRAVLATDLVGFPSTVSSSDIGDDRNIKLSSHSFAVEIKPKWAFLPNPKYLSPETKRVKTNHSRFVMHSHYRAVEDGKESAGEGLYDPLDLFSGDPKRVGKAVGALWDAWAGSGDTVVNNLKIFVDGRTIGYDAAMPNLAPLLNISQVTSLEHVKTSFVDRVVQLLLEQPVLEILAQHQSTLDSLDIEGLHHIWKKHHLSKSQGNDIPPLGGGYPEPTLEEWDSFVTSYLSRASPQSDISDPPTAEEVRYHVLAYVMSATFKDCSIILGLGGERQTVTVIDLDPKPVARLEKWRQLDRDIAKRYADYQASLTSL